MRRVYLDHAATTPVHPQVVRAMDEVMLEVWGNPSSLHSFGREARQRLDAAREAVARLIGARPAEIVFTGGGTEADNLAIRGVAQARRARGRHIITSRIEHHAVLHTCETLEDEGFEVTYLPVDRHGRVDPDDVRRALTPETVLVTIMLANNEVGSIQPVAEIARIARDAGACVHTDAVQCVGNTPVDVDDLAVDLLTLSAHKMYGPKGVGALYARQGTGIRPIIHGGAHEHELRAGTENMPGIVGLGKAAAVAATELPQRVEHVAALRDRFVAQLQSRLKGVTLNGHPSQRLPNNANLSFAWVEGEAILLGIDARGIAASTGSACTSARIEASHVLTAMGVPAQEAQGALRFTFGRENTPEDVDLAVEAISETVERLRAMSPLYPG